VTDAVDVRVSVAVADEVAVSVAVADGDDVCVDVTDAVLLRVSVALAVTDAVRDHDTEEVGEPVSEGVALREAVGVELGLAIPYKYMSSLKKYTARSLPITGEDRMPIVA
jgi:hypothetical protein